MTWLEHRFKRENLKKLHNMQQKGRGKVYELIKVFALF